MSTETDVHLLEVWETERNLHNKWLSLKITKETLTFERCFLPKAVLSNASPLYMTRSDVFVCEAERNKNICHVNETFFCDFYSKFAKRLFTRFIRLIVNWTFVPAILFEVLLFTYKYIVFENHSHRKAILSTSNKQKSLNWVFWQLCLFACFVAVPQ